MSLKMMLQLRSLCIQTCIVLSVKHETDKLFGNSGRNELKINLQKDIPRPIQGCRFDSCVFRLDFITGNGHKTMAFQSGQNCQQFSWSKPVPISWSNTYFYGQNSHFCGQNSHFCCQNWFFNVQTYKFSCQIMKYLGQSPFHSNAKFHAQPYSIPILCSTPFLSNSISWSVTIS